MTNFRIPHTRFQICHGWILGLAATILAACAYGERPNIVLVMADDQGWGQVGYYDHPTLKTPNLDAMAANGLRFDRFYAGAPVCSPTRASVLTGRANDRTGVYQHGNALRLQERALPEAMRKAGYATGHFGKWHLNGIRGPGVPILGDDKYHPGRYGYEYWLSVTNFFDLDPIMSRNGDFEEFEGDSSVIIVDEALAYMKTQVEAGKPFFTTIWYGSPHAPMMAIDDDLEPFADLEKNDAHHYGELVAMDRSIGNLRRGLRELGIADNTLFWYCSDNGGLRVTPESVNGLRGLKGTVYEGGLRVPGIIEWPSAIPQPAVSKTPAGVVDIFPTLAEIVGLPEGAMLEPYDGVSLKRSIEGRIPKRRQKPIPFRYMGKGAMVDNQYKLVVTNVEKKAYELYDLSKDPDESNDLFQVRPAVGKRLAKAYEAWNETVNDSDAGKDYAEGKLADPNPRRVFWMDMPEYEPYFPDWKKRPEYKGRFK